MPGSSLEASAAASFWSRRTCFGSLFREKEEFADRGRSYQEALPVKLLTPRLDPCGRRQRDGRSRIAESMTTPFPVMHAACSLTWENGMGGWSSRGGSSFSGGGEGAHGGGEGIGTGNGSWKGARGRMKGVI